MRTGRQRHGSKLRFRLSVGLAGLIPLAGLTGLASAQAVTAAPAPAAAASATTGPAACGPVWTSRPAAPDPAGQTSELLAVTRTSNGTAWAVGETKTSGLAITEKLTSSGWVHEPAHAPGNSVLSAVAAASPTDIWAVGQIDGNTTSPHPLIEHWNGSQWSVVTGPAVSAGLLDSVAVLGPGDAWAVGSRKQGQGQRTLIEHWDGTSWSIVPSPNRFEQNVLTAVAGSSARAIWAIGTTNGYPLAEYWDGIDWRVVSTPEAVSLQPEALTVISGSDAWAAGFSLNPGGPDALHWNGKTWQLVPLVRSAVDFAVTGMAATGPRDIWAVGEPNGPWPLPENFNGDFWRLATAPRVADESWTGGVTSLPDGGALAVGASETIEDGTSTSHGEAWSVCPAQVTGQAFAPAAVTDPDWLTVTWRSAGHSALTVRDGSGLGLFRSAALPSGATYSFRYYAAGSYPVAVSPGPARQVVSVPLNARPAVGHGTNTYLLTWAARVAPFGLAYDVRVKAPGASEFTAFRTGVSSIQAYFTAGASGTYEFEARLRNYTTGTHSGWSPPRSLTVTG
jgi:hypothetical protein